MRLYTIESENKQYVAVEGKDGRPAALDSLGINVTDCWIDIIVKNITS